MSDDQKPAASVASAYDRWAVSYDSEINRTRDLDGVVVRHSAPDVAGRDVLELGAGTGKNTVWLAERARSVIGLDVSPGMLAVARPRAAATNVQFIEHDITTPFPISNASVDVVIANLVFEHIDRFGPVFTESARVLRPGGAMFICELHPIRQFLGGRAHFVDAANGEVVNVTVFRHTVSEFVNVGIGAGLSVESMGEWSDEETSEAPPRLLSMRFIKR